MKSFYSILYCTVRPNVDERVSIGLFLGNNNGCLFQYSAEKLAVIKDLYSDEAFQNVKITLKSLSKISAENVNAQLSTYPGGSTLKENYFSYLSRYSNNLITYSAPTTLDAEPSQEVFNKLFEKFIFELSASRNQALKPVEWIKKRLVKSIAGHVNFDAEINSQLVPGLVVPAKVLFIGKNEVQVTGESKDFSGQRPHIIQQQINAHLFLVEKIREMNDGNKGHFFFIGDEPSKQLTENHRLWKAVKESKTLDLVPTSEIEKVEEYLMTHGVQPLFPK